MIIRDGTKKQLDSDLLVNMAWIKVCLIVLLIQSTVLMPLDLCNKKGTSTYINYTSDITKYCGCSDPKKCLRKCCQQGYYLHHKEYSVNYTFIEETVCIKNPSHEPFNFRVPIYNKTKLLFYENKFMIGLLPCNKLEPFKYFKINNSDPNELFFIQDNGVLYFPVSDRKFYSNDRFCVDENEGLSVFVCYSLKERPLVFVLGM